jgi:hypothetical protein
MKKSVIFFVLLFVFLASDYANNDYSERGNEPKSEKEAGIDHPIVGKWEYVKTIRPDGSEVISLIAIEHYYSDGTLLFVDVHLHPQMINEFSDSPEEIKNNFRNAYGGIATYKIEKGKERDLLTFTAKAFTQMKNIGKSHSIELKVDEDILIFYPTSGDQYIMKRVADK